MTTYAEACSNPHLFGEWFDGPSWDTWRVLDKAIFGEALTTDELIVFTELTGRSEPPTEAAKETFLIAGRRSGKDVKAASIVTYLATFGPAMYGLLDNVKRGESVVVQLLAVDRKQAAVCLKYVKAFFEKPIFAAMVEKETADGLELSNGVAITITTNDLASARGRTTIAVVMDELAFFNSDTSTNPAEEVYRALRPGMATVPNAMLIGISSPFAPSGLLFDVYKKHFGKPGRTLVVQAPTWRMNPTLAYGGEFLAGEREADPAAFNSEYGAQFRDSSTSLFGIDALMRCVDEGVLERPFVAGTRYFGFVDAASGSGGDSATAAVASREGESVIIHAYREIKPPFSPSAAVVELAGFLKSYGLRHCYGDRWTGDVIREMFRKEGVDYKPSTASRSQLYLGMLPLVNAQRVALLDCKRTLNQFTSLIRRVTKGGQENIDAPQGAAWHEDVANAVAGAAYYASKGERSAPMLAAPQLIPLVDYY